MILHTIQIIGEGNVAYHLARGFCCIPDVVKVSVLSRRSINAELFKAISGKIEVNNLDSFDYEAPITFIVVSDDAIPEIARRYNLYKKMIVHTSGSTGTEVFHKLGYINYGAFYPLQTFSFKKEILWPEVPVFVNSNSRLNDELLIEIASQLSLNTQIITDEKRLNIHIAAVMVNNFTNHLYSLSENWLKENEMDFQILLPLIRETTDKLTVLSPHEAQTGPAKRKDQKIIQLHLSALSRHPELYKIYELMSKSLSGQLSD